MGVESTDRPRLPLRTQAARAVGRAVSGASRLAGRGRGQVIGGQAMLRVDPAAIAHLARGMAVTLVSATNGKSTTTRFIAEALRTLGPVAHNSTGANMPTGIVTALADDWKATHAALEVDEAYLPQVMTATRANVIVLMNLSRDQLDRNLEVKRLAERWRTALSGLDWNATVVANADDPLVAWAAEAAERVVWVAGGQWWHDDSELCPDCGSPLQRDGRHWQCSSCGLIRPATSWELGEDGRIHGPGVEIKAELALPGRVNLANAVIAAAAVAESGVPADRAVAAFGSVRDVDGRYIEAQAVGHDIRLLLGKNPASWTELIDIVRTSGRELVIVINARGADGRDPSWLWDVPFERLAGRTVIAAGERRFDLAVRLNVAGLEVSVIADPLDAAASLAAGRVDIVANYTAFQDLRERVQ